MYRYKEYIFPSLIVHEYHFKGHQGAKGEKRVPKKNITPEQIQAHNQRHKEKKVQFLILENFTKGDYYTTLTYRNGTGKDIGISEVKSDLRAFLDKMRRAYKRRGTALKFISRIEKGSEGGTHIHLIINRVDDTDLLIDRCWEHGRPHNALIDDSDPTMSKLAEYMTKPPSDKAVKKQRALSDTEDASKLIAYSCSRNLKRPVPKEREYSNRNMSKILNADIKPTEGFYIDQDIKPPVKGINPYNGWSYLTYQEIRLTKGIKAEPVRFCECPTCHQFTLNGFICDCYLKKRKRKIT